MYSNEHTLQDLLKQAFHRLDMDDTANEIDVKYAYRQVAGNLINQLTPIFFVSLNTNRD